MNCLYIYRRDLRIKDNTTLNYLIKKGYNIYPIFIFNEKQVKTNRYKSEYCINFMIESLSNLKKELKNKLKYIIVKDDEISNINKIVKENNITSIGYNIDNTYYSRERDKKIEEYCKRQGIEHIALEDYTLFPINSILTGEGKYYETYNYFYKKALEKNIRKPRSEKYQNAQIKMLKIDDEFEPMTLYNKQLKNKSVTIGGRVNALKLINPSIVKRLKNYEKTRVYPKINTSFLGAHLKFGNISIREFYEKVKSNKSLVGQIFWKEFYVNLFINLGYKKTIGGDNYKGKKIKWENNEKLFEKWCTGNTGFPLVDAGMRQLNSIGWMHNRTRMLCANFLSLILHINWTKGERYFAQKLIDYDVAINNGNWQWSVGLGVDRTSYIRIFNPETQIQRLDKDCVYIKRWVKELENVDNKIIKTWQQNNESKHSNINYVKYSKPCVDYKTERLKSLKVMRTK